MLYYLYNLATDKYKGIVAGALKPFLYFLSLIYGLIVRILIFVYSIKPYQLNCKVISVGNITLGGTGKTSLVALIAKYLKGQGRKVAILTRGYKRKVISHNSSFDRLRTLRRRTLSEVEVQVTSYEAMGDEPYMLFKNLEGIPVIVNKNRVMAGKSAIYDYGVDTVILDDGLQQWLIKKDLEIVTIDTTRPFGNRNLIPRGILREPLSSLKRADLFVLTKSNLNPDTQDLKDFLSSVNPEGLIVESIHSPVGFYRVDKKEDLLKPEALKAKTVTSISGIADPDSFENLIVSLGINVGLTFRFPDHHSYSQKELENIIRQSQEQNIDTIVTTEKDAVRLCDMRYAIPARPAGGCDMQIFALRIELVITKDEQRFYNRLLQLYSL